MPLVFFLISCLCAFIAGHMVNYSIIFLATQWFNSHAIAGIGYSLCFGPPLILGWFAGVYCDRYSPRKVILVMQNSFLVSVSLLGAAFYFDTSYQLPLLLSAALFSGIGWSFVAPARFATLPFYVSSQKLAGATITLNVMVMTGFGLAPLLLKLIKVNFDWQTVLLTIGLLFIASSLLLLPLRFQFSGQAKNKTWLEIKSSLLFVKNSSALKPLLILSMITYLLMGPMQVLLPSIAEHQLGLNETNQGYYLSVIALSLIIGGVIAMKIKDKGNVGLVMMLCMLLAGIGIAFLGSEQHLTLSIIILFITAACGGIAISFIVAGIQSFSDDKNRGRIMSFYSIISQVIPALSGVFAGILAQTFSPTIALYFIAGLIIMSTLICLIMLTNIRQLMSFNYA